MQKKFVVGNICPVKTSEKKRGKNEVLSVMIRVYELTDNKKKLKNINNSYWLIHKPPDVEKKRSIFLKTFSDAVLTFEHGDVILGELFRLKGCIDQKNDEEVVILKKRVFDQHEPLKKERIEMEDLHQQLVNSSSFDGITAAFGNAVKPVEGNQLFMLECNANEPPDRREALIKVKKLTIKKDGKKRKFCTIWTNSEDTSFNVHARMCDSAWTFAQTKVRRKTDLKNVMVLICFMEPTDSLPRYAPIINDIIPFEPSTVAQKRKSSDQGPSSTVKVPRPSTQGNGKENVPINSVVKTIQMNIDGPAVEGGSNFASPPSIPSTSSIETQTARKQELKLSDEEKRWLVAGICINKLLPEALIHLQQKMEEQYHQPNPLGKDGNSNLHYKNINGNRGRRSGGYDKTIRSAFDLAKLYLQDPSHKITGFSRMDISAAMNILERASVFSGLTRKCARYVREARNMWGHRVLSDWSEQTLENCFQHLDQLLLSFGGKNEEILEELREWKKRGMELAIGDEQLSEYKEQIKILQKQADVSSEVKVYLLEIGCNITRVLEQHQLETNQNFTKVHDKMDKHRHETREDIKKLEELIIQQSNKRT